NIPAATQLFTPHWIVRYLVENSLGRLWLLNRPQSKLAAKMDYYIAPEEPETDFLRITRPEDIRICDPACGSGHMLTYAFDLLYEIYAEEGHDAAEIPGLILKHNLTGIEIDDRAGALAAFAMSMKAAARLGRRRFLRMEEKPDIVVLQDVRFTPAEMQDVAAVVGKDLFTDELRETLGQFERAKNFGSLIVPKLRDPAEALRVVEARDFGADLLLKEVQERVVAVLRMAEALGPKYHVAVANPPYMGGKGMNGKLGDFVKASYPESKSDLFAVFMERALGLCAKRGLMAMINMQSWMFLSSYEKLRVKLLSDAMILSMAHLGERAFDSIGGAVVSTTAFVIENAHSLDHEGTFIRLVDGSSEAEKEAQLKEAIQNPNCGWFHRASAEDFEKIPGSPIAYWLSERYFKIFEEAETLKESAEVKHGLSTGKNEEVVRLWSEVNAQEFGSRHQSRDAALASGDKWFPYNKGGEFRKWFGNCEYVLRYDEFGNSLMATFSGHRHDGKSHYFLEGVTWTFISSSSFAARYTYPGF
ncbi:MAG: BREX-1 system adenine-specific DNA-methyltransferase PglX, partial [Rhizobiaceae bacterium]